MRENTTYSRRDFLSVAGLYVGGFLLGHRSQIPSPDLDDFIYKKMERSHIPGLAVAIVRQRQVIWSKGYGWANIDQKIKMTPISFRTSDLSPKHLSARLSCSFETREPCNSMTT
jgi:CubicO group peptidase (beta-lactamase class C family)